MAEAGGGRGRSVLSDITPDPGPGPIQSRQELDSLERCATAIRALFELSNSRLSRFNNRDIRTAINDDVLADIVRWYWYNEKRDRRTKASDLKRELKTIVTHLKYVVEEMKGVPPATRLAIDLMLMPLKGPMPRRQEVFGEAERLNTLLLKHFQPLVESNFTRQSSSCIIAAGESLASLWENISHESFKRNKKYCEASQVVSDKFEFESEGMHFVHVMLQSIDPTVTFSKVRSAMVRVAARAPRKPKIEN